MRYPNLRYGNPNELRYYAQGFTVRQLAKQLRRSERTVSDWLDGKKKIPFWVPELLRLRYHESTLRLRQMGFGKLETQLGIVRADVVEFSRPLVPVPQSPPDTPRAVFDAAVKIASNG